MDLRISAGRMLVAWLAIVALVVLIAIGQGRVLDRWVGARRADLLASLVAAVAVLAAQTRLVPWVVSSDGRGTRVLVGSIWVAGIVALDLGLRRVLAGLPWNVIVEGYNVLAGRTWGLTMPVIAIGPLIVVRRPKRGQ